MAKLGDVCVSITDGSHNPPVGVTQSSFIMLSSKNIEDDHISLTSPRYLSKSDYANENKRTQILEGDLLVTIVGTIGRVAIVPSNLEGICVQRSVAVLKVNPDIVYNRFLMYQLQNMRPLLEREAKGVAQKGIYLKQLSSLVVSTPPIEDQKRIAAVLDKVTDLIAQRRAQLDKLDLLVKSRFVEMFGDPACSTRWPTKKLSQLGELNRGVSKHRPRNDPALLGGPYPLIQTGDVSNSGLYITEYSASYSELGLAQSRLWKAGTLCITIAANIAQTSILTFDSCFPDSVVGFVPGNETNAIFIHYWFSFFQKILEEQAPQVAQKNINLKILSDLDVIVPPCDLQESFSFFVRNIEKTKLTIYQSLDKLQIMKKSIMQSCFG